MDGEKSSREGTITSNSRNYFQANYCTAVVLSTEEYCGVGAPLLPDRPTPVSILSIMLPILSVFFLSAQPEP